MDFSISFAGLLCARIALALSPLRTYLQDNQLLASPLTSYSRLQEGIYLSKKGIDPYFGGPFHHSPLYLSLFSTVIPTGSWISPILWTCADGIAAAALVRIWRARQGVAHSNRDTLVAAAYLLNPYTLLPTISLSTSAFDNMLVLLVVMFAAEGHASRASLLALALATHSSLPSVLLLLPVVLLLLSKPASQLASPQFHPLYTRFKTLRASAGKHVGIFVLYTGILALLAATATGDFTFRWMKQTWGVGLSLTDLSPNVGLWWYFFTEMFDHFRPFFLAIFSIHMGIYVMPICIKFQHDPLYATFLLVGLTAMFKPYPTLADSGLFLSSLVLFPEVYPYMRYSLPATLIHLHAALLLPLFHNLWLTIGTGNANFLYAATLLFGLGNGMMILDTIWAGLRIAVGKGYEGRDIEVIQR